MASFFYQDGTDTPTQDRQGQAGEPTHLKAISGGRSVARPEASSSWGDSQASAPLATAGSERRSRVAPPELFMRSPSTVRAWLSQAWSWLWDMEDAPRKPAPTTGMAQARAEFHSAIWDLQSMRANHLRDQIANARSLRELWHLRADVFKLISMHRGQAEAQLRLDALDNHFPVRSSVRAGSPRGKVAAW